MNKRGMSFFSIVLLLTALTVGAAITMGNLTPEQINAVKENLTVEHIDFTDAGMAPELNNALDHWVNGVIQAYISLTKWVMSYTVEHPEVPYKLLLYLLLLSILAPLIVALVKLLIIIFLLIREYFQSRKEKQLIKSYKGGKTWT